MFSECTEHFSGIDSDFHSKFTFKISVYCAQLSCAKTVVEKFSFSELKIEKVKFFTQSLTKIFYTRVFNVGRCLASCLTFRPFLTLDS